MVKDQFPHLLKNETNAPQARRESNASIQAKSVYLQVFSSGGASADVDRRVRIWIKEEERRTMKSARLPVLICLVLAALLGHSPTAVADATTLSLMTWEGYVSEEMIQDFKRETGITLKVTYIVNNDELIGNMRATGGKGYDLVQPSVDRVFEAQRELEIYQPIDFSMITIMDNLIGSQVEAAKAISTVGGRVYSIPYAWGTSGLIVNTKKIHKDSYSWMDLYDEKWCGRVTIPSGWPAFVGAGYGLGWDVFKNYRDESRSREMIDAITDFLISKKRCIKSHRSARQEQIDLMAREEVWISQGWDGTGWLLGRKYPSIRFFAPEEGALGWMDTFTIPAGAENLEGAYKWINFVLTPERAGHLIEQGWFLSSVEGSTDFLPEAQQSPIERSLPPPSMEKIRWFPTAPVYVRELGAQAVERFEPAE
jgi:spermidine/putrescine transport system substrate-binding protein